MGNGDPGFGLLATNPELTNDPGRLVAVAQLAEGLGLDAVWTNDHVVIPSSYSSAYPYSADGSYRGRPSTTFLEPLTTLSYLAGATRTLRLGTWVVVMPYRNPVLVAKQAATLDFLSGGRLDLGVGVGWLKEEFEALGYDYYEQRGAVLDEQIQVMRALWSQDVTSFDGQFYKFAEMGMRPWPVQSPGLPIWIGGTTRPAIRRAARLGDGWLPLAGPQIDYSPAGLTISIATLHGEATRAGRDPAAIKICFAAGLSFDQTDGSAGTMLPSALRGSPDDVISGIRQYLDAGVQRFCFSFGPAQAMEATMRRFAADVLPAFR